MSDQVSRQEFEEMKGQVAYLAHKLGIELSEGFAEGSGRHRAEVSEDSEARFDGFDQSEDIELGDEADYSLAVGEEEEDGEEAEGWESINDDEDEEHNIQAPESHSLPVLPLAYEETEEQDTVNAVEAEEDEEGFIPTELDAEDNDDDDRPNPFGGTPSLHTGESTDVEADDYSEIFDSEDALTANHVATQEFSSIKKGLFNTPYDEDAVDDYLDAVYDVLLSRDASEKKYAEALLGLRNNHFPEATEGYKKSEVDDFMEKIANELQRRIDILS